MLSGESIYFLPASMVEISMPYSMLPICLANCSAENYTEHWPGILEIQNNCMKNASFALRASSNTSPTLHWMSYRNRAPSHGPSLNLSSLPLMLLPNRVCCSSNHPHSASSRCVMASRTRSSLECGATVSTIKWAPSLKPITCASHRRDASGAWLVRAPL